MRNQSIHNHIDWISVFIYIIMVVMGFLNIYSSSLSITSQTAPLIDFTQIYGKQIMFILLSLPLIVVILALDGKFYEKYTSLIFGFALLLIAGLFVFGKTIKGQANWYSFGGFGFQPSEFAKAATSLALAKFLSDPQVNLKDRNRQLQALGIIALPVLLILPHDPGSALIYAVFMLVLYREGLPPWYLWTGFIAILLFVFALILQSWAVILIAGIVTFLVYLRSRLVDRNWIASIAVFVAASVFVLSVGYVFDHIFKQHHRDRFNILLGKQVDMKGIGYNINQSKIAIGSGGWFGKGYLEGTQTKGGFVPEEHTDYIFTTVGEEWGFVGSIVVIILFIGLIMRIIYLAERQKTGLRILRRRHLVHPLLHKHCHGCWDLSHDWRAIAILLIRRLRTLGLHDPAVHIPKDGCQ